MPAALTHGYTRGFVLGGVLMLTAAVVVLALIRIGPSAAADEEDAAAPVHVG